MDELSGTPSAAEMTDHLHPSVAPAAQDQQALPVGAIIQVTPPARSHDTARQVSRRLPLWPARQPRRPVLLTALAVGCLLLIIGGLIANAAIQSYSADYHTEMAAADTGMRELRAAAEGLSQLRKNPLDVQVANQIHAHFVAARSAFVTVEHGLTSLPTGAALLPGYGGQVRAAMHLVPLAIDIADAGLAGSSALTLVISRLQDPLNAQQGGIGPDDMTTLQGDVAQFEHAADSAIAAANALQPADMSMLQSLSPHAVQALHDSRTQLPTLHAWISTANELLTVAPTLLGIAAPTSYLIEVLDSTELRPGGGFIGNVGIATVSQGRLQTLHITDVDLLDRPFEAAGGSIPYPSAYRWFDLAPASWSLRDSNLTADFPTTARYGEQNYKLEGGTVPVQGVIAITPALIQRILDITGPVTVPEYGETVTAQNLIDRIHFHQLGPNHGSDIIPSPDGHSSLRKRFTELLAEHLMAKMQTLPASARPALFQALLTSLQTKDMQLYANMPDAESLLQQFGLASTIQSPTGDSLFVVDANIAGNKANDLIANTVRDHVTLDGAGNAIHSATITYSWTLPGQNYGNHLYRGYVQVYVPPRSVLVAQSGWDPRGTGQAFGRQVWAGFFTLTVGQTRTITLIWKTPSVATHTADGWRYRYLIQRQPGALRNLALQVTLQCHAPTARRWLGLSQTANGEASLEAPLVEDTHVGVDYACAP